LLALVTLVAKSVVEWNMGRRRKNAEAGH